MTGRIGLLLAVCVLASPSTGWFAQASPISFSKGGFSIIQSEGNALEYTLEANGKTVVKGHFGLALPNAIGIATNNCDPQGADACYEWGDFAQMLFTAPSGDNNCATVEWSTTYGRRLEDCFDLVNGVHWYGGAETKLQTWPIESEKREEAAYVTGDFLQPVQFGGLLETYWLTSSGLALHVAEDTPLFTSWDTTRPNQFCLAAQDRNPYTERNEVRMKYDLCAPKTGETFKDVHQRSIKRYYGTPSGTPDEVMLVRPFWSTWAQYREGINQSTVLDMAHRIIAGGYELTSHIEIDDNWESCYGEAQFNSAKFPDPIGLIKELEQLGINRTTVWIHPFINYECPSFTTAFQNGYFVQDAKSKSGITSWWQGQNSGLIDFSNEDAVNWWRARLEKLQETTGITSFKFDAGEALWLPASSKLTTGDSNLMPNILSTKYVEAVSYFGGLIETRSAHRNQRLPMYIRMLDKDSRWDNLNGLRSMIPTLLLFSITGYSYCMPDMIGGNAYGAMPEKELYLRWAQLNVFMPAWQFSILPWLLDPADVEFNNAVKAAVDLRLKYEDKILAAARQTVIDGSPMNRPMWWVDPEDPMTYGIDDQFMLGDDILVAPVVIEGARSRDIYLPKGTWTTETPSGPETVVGPRLLIASPAPLDYLPFFVKQSE